MDDPYGRIGDGTNFSVSYQLPLRSKGRLGYRRNLKLIHKGLCEPRAVKSLVDLLCSSRLPKEMPRINFWFRKHYCVDCFFQQLHHVSFAGWTTSFRCPTSPRVTRWMGDVASLSLLLGPIYIGVFFLLPLTSLTISFLPTRPRSSSSFLLSFQVFLLPS